MYYSNVHLFEGFGVQGFRDKFSGESDEEDCVFGEEFFEVEEDGLCQDCFRDLS